MESGAEQNTDSENVLSQSFPSIGFLILTSVGLGFFLNQDATASFSSFQTQLLKTQGLFNPCVLVVTPLKQYFYYFPDDFFKPKMI